MLGDYEASEEIMNDIPNLMGNAFEQIAKEYLIRKAKERKLPFIPFMSIPPLESHFVQYKYHTVQ